MNLANVDIHNRDMTTKELADLFFEYSSTYTLDGKWDDKKKALYIEHILCRLPLTPIHLLLTNDGWKVIDGKNRLIAIIDFINEDLRLEGMELGHEYEGCNITTIPKYKKRHFLEANIPIQVISFCNMPEGDKAKFLENYKNRY